MVLLPPPECAAAPSGSVVLVPLPSTRGFLLFFCNSHTLPQPPKYSSSLFPRSCLPRCPTLLARFSVACERSSVYVCVYVNMTRKHWCFTLDFPTGCVIGGEGARAPVPSSGSMWALWQQAGQLLNHTCLYPSPLHKYGGGGGQNRGTAPSHKCQRCCQ